MIVTLCKTIWLSFKVAYMFLMFFLMSMGYDLKNSKGFVYDFR